MIGTILMFIFQVPYKKFDRKYLKYLSYIYVCFDIFFARGEHIFFYICYNLFLQGENTFFIIVITCSTQGRTYNIFFAGGVFMHTKCHHQKGGECWNLLLMIRLWRHIIELYLISLFKSSTWSRLPKESCYWCVL